MLFRSPPGGVVARFGVGHDGVDKAQAARRGILCCNTPGVLDNSVAECAIGLMLAAARRIALCAAANRAGKWNPPAPGTELSGKVLAVIGCGNIGRKVAAIAKYGLGMKTVGFDVRTGRTDEIDETVRDFSAAVREADFVTIHIPYLPETRDFIGRERLEWMKRSAILVNTARGGVLDENALFDAVASGTIAGAALDVCKKEPYSPQHPEKDLRTLDGVLMTPHIGSSTREACRRMAEAALRNIGLAVQGKTDEMNLLLPENN